MTALRIERVHALEHTATGAAQQQAPGPDAVAVRVHLHATADNRPRLAVGEARPAEPHPPAEQRAAWASLTAACRELTGHRLEPSLDVEALATELIAAPGPAYETARRAIVAALTELVAPQPAPGPQLRYEALLPEVHRHFWSPAPAPIRDPEGRAANVYDMTMYQGFSRLGLASQRIQQAAVARGLRTLRLGAQDFTAWDGAGRTVSFAQSSAQDSSAVSGLLTDDKQLTRHLLAEAGVPAPHGRVFRFSETEDALTFAGRLGWPVVLKPLRGYGGVGVSTGLADGEQLAAAIGRLRAATGDRGRFVVEQHVPGADYRIYVSYGEVLSVVLRRPASVTGDGQRTVGELVLANNYLRLRNPHTRSRPIRADRTADDLLRRQGAGWGTVVPEGSTILLAEAANLSRGGDSTEVLPETHPSVIQAAVAAVGAIPGLSQAGVDLLLTDHRQPITEQHAGVCEVNSIPAMMANEAVMFGPPQPVADGVLRHAALARGLQLEEAVPDVRLEVHARGVPEAARLRRWLVKHARRLDLGGRFLSAGPGELRLLLAGPTTRATMLAAAMCAGRRAQLPDSVHTAPYLGEVPASFEDDDDR